MSRVAIGLGLALFLSGPAEALTVRDMLDRQVRLPALPRRIVSLVPSVTEIIFALGAEDRLVGVTDYCDFPPPARDKPSVGGMVAPSLEAIVILRPDLVVATDEGNRIETFHQLERLNIPFYVVRANRLGEMMDVIARLGELTETKGEVVSLRDRLERRIRAVATAVRPLRRLRVLYVLWPEPLIVPGRAAIVTQLIRLAGGESITAGDAGDYPRYSLEAAVVREPEVVILANHGTGSEAISREKWERLASLPAVKTGRIHSMDGNLLHRYGPRVVDGLEALARVLHPEAFE